MSDPALDYFRHVMTVKNWTAADLAREAGVSHSTINRPLTTPGWANRISRGTIQKVHAASGIDPTDFLGPTEAPFAIPSGVPAPNGAKLVSVYDVQASAGPGSAVDDYETVAYSLAFPPSYLSKLTSSDPRNLAIISVKGDSMDPTLRDDDIVMLDMSKTNLSYDGLFVLRFGDALHVKRVARSAKQDHITIVSDNARVPAQDYPASEVQVIGKVIWGGGKM